MDERLDRVVSLPRESGLAEERMLRGDLVREIVARKERGEGIKRIARELGVDRKTVRRWLRFGGWQPRRPRPRPRPIDQFTDFIARRGPEIGCEWSGAAPRAGGPGVHWQLSAAPALSQTPSGPAHLGGAGDGSIRDRARRTGPGRLRPAAGLDWRAARDRALFVLRLGYSRRLLITPSQREAGEPARWSRARVSPFWRSHA